MITAAVERRSLTVMVGVGPPSMTCGVDPTEALDASLRRHDEDDTPKSGFNGGWYNVLL